MCTRMHLCVSGVIQDDVYFDESQGLHNVNTSSRFSGTFCVKVHYSTVELSVLIFGQQQRKASVHLGAIRQINLCDLILSQECLNM